MLKGSWFIKEWKKWKETKVRKDGEWVAFKNKYHDEIADLQGYQILLFELLISTMDSTLRSTTRYASWWLTFR